MQRAHEASTSSHRSTAGGLSREGHAGQEFFGNGKQVAGEVTSKDHPEMKHKALLARQRSIDELTDGSAGIDRRKQSGLIAFVKEFLPQVFDFVE